MDRVEEFLQNLDLKFKIMIYIFILFAAGIIYYYFNYNYLGVKINENQRKIETLKSKVNLSLNHYYEKLNKLKKEYKKLKAIEISKNEDLKYLIKRINLSPLKIDEKEFYSLLEKILEKSISLNLNPNFYIEEDFSNFKKYVLKIEGKFSFCEEKNIFELLKFLESVKYVESIDKFYLDKNKSAYFIKYTIWGIK